MRLSETFADRAEMVTLEIGYIADYFTSTIGMEVDIRDKLWKAQKPYYQGKPYHLVCRPGPMGHGAEGPPRR